MGGSHFHLAMGKEGGAVPRVDMGIAPRLFHKLHDTIRQGLLRACHDLSEGGLATALAEMAFAGEVGADITLASMASVESDEVLLYSESPTRFIVEVAPAHAAAFQACFGEDVPVYRIGQTVKEPRLRIAGGNGEWIIWASLADLKEAWQRPLRW